jgi:hypothetical protein
MANKNLFASIAGKLAPKTTAMNEAGSKAYAMTPEHALAQYAATGCLSGTFNIGGFSDGVFDLIAHFAAGRMAAGHWMDVIESIALDESAVA